jgi:hypothetical protein
MDKEFIPYEQALVLKELGFNEPCLCFYNYNSQLLRYMNPDKDWNSLQSQTLKNSKITLPDTYSAPLYSQAFRWFRERYQASPTIHCISEQDNSWRYHIPNEGGERDFLTYEEAELACLIKLIEIVKENKQ